MLFLILLAGILALATLLAGTVVFQIIGVALLIAGAALFLFALIAPFTYRPEDEEDPICPWQINTYREEQGRDERIATRQCSLPLGHPGRHA